MGARDPADPKHWRQCAEEARVLAEFMTDPGAKNTMFEIAASYEDMAIRAEQEKPRRKSTRRGATPRA
jgi:hypothetical protein